MVVELTGCRSEPNAILLIREHRIKYTSHLAPLFSWSCQASSEKLLFYSVGGYWCWNLQLIKVQRKKCRWSTQQQVGHLCHPSSRLKVNHRWREKNDCKNQRSSKIGTKQYLDMTGPLHSWTHSSYTCLQKFKQLTF